MILAVQKMADEETFRKINGSPRSIHYLLKTTEDGIDDSQISELPPAIMLMVDWGLFQVD